VAMLIARYHSETPSVNKPILLLAHMDIVDARPEDWERDPFTMIEEDGYFFGRGTHDNKLGVTALVSSFIRLKGEGFTPKRDLILAFSGDEETGMETTRALVTTYRELTDAEYALNADAGGGHLDESGDPSSFVIQAAEKTYATFELTIRNPGGHSSLPRSDNAIYELAGALKKIEAYRFPPMINDVTRQYLLAESEAKGGAIGEAMRDYATNPNNLEAADTLYDIPDLVGVTRTTCVATMLRAGHAENALPQSATATVNCRIFPGVSVETIMERLQTIVENAAVEFQILGEPMASPASPLLDGMILKIEHVVHTAHPGLPIIPYMAPYATDGKEVRAAGIPTYGVSGLFIKSSDVFAHGLNERIPVKGFYDALEYWHDLMIQLGE